MDEATYKRWQQEAKALITKHETKWGPWVRLRRAFDGAERVFNSKTEIALIRAFAKGSKTTVQMVILEQEGDGVLTAGAWSIRYE